MNLYKITASRINKQIPINTSQSDAALSRWKACVDPQIKKIKTIGIVINGRILSMGLFHNF